MDTHAFVESDPSETHPGEVDKGCDGGEIEEPAEDDGSTGVYSCEEWQVSKLDVHKDEHCRVQENRRGWKRKGRRKNVLM